MNRMTLGEKIFQIFNYFLMLLFIFITLYPVWYVLVASFSSGTSVNAGLVTFWVKDFTLSAYEDVVKKPELWIGYANTIFYSVFGTLLNMILTMTAAYALSKRRLVGRRAFNIYLNLTMWFGAGMIPTYLNIRSLGLLDSRIGLLLHGAVSAYYIILMRSYFESVPTEMEESALIDGASDFKTFVDIYIPLSVPAIMTLTLYYFVGHWNAYFWSMILLTDAKKFPLQVYLRKWIVELKADENTTVAMDYTSKSETTGTYALIMIAIIPMLIIYPFIQKFFTKGIMLGAVKG